MANRWVANGTSTIIDGTLGDITASKIRAVGYVDWGEGDGGYWVSQAGSTTSTREFGIFEITNNLKIWTGGNETDLGSFTSIFGTSRAVGILDMTIDTDGSYTLYLNGDLKSSGGAGSVARGAGRVADMLFRVGSRASTDTSATTSTYRAVAGVKFGDLQLYIDDVIVINYQMQPAGYTGTNIPNTAGTDGTLYGGTLDGSDWETFEDKRKKNLFYKKGDRTAFYRKRPPTY